MDFIALWTTFVSIFFIVFTLLKLIAPFTDTDKDDKAILILSKIMDAFSVKATKKSLTIKVNR